MVRVESQEARLERVTEPEAYLVIRCLTALASSGTG